MIHSTAIVSDKAKLGKNISVGAYSIIYDNVELGDNTQIEAFCEIGYPTKLAEDMPLIIESGALVRSHSILYQGSSFGENLTTGHRVTIREKTNAGKNIQIGTLSDIQGDCIFGDYVRLHSNVHIGKTTQVGNYVWIFPYVVVTNDPHPPSNQLSGVNIKDFSIIATSSVLLPGVTVGFDSLVGAMSLVKKDVPDSMVVSGNPAEIVCSVEKIRNKFDRSKRVYPWRYYFERGMPWEGIGYENWLASLKKD